MSKFDKLAVDDDDDDDARAKHGGEHPLEAWRRRQFEKQVQIDAELNEHPLFMVSEPKPGEKMSDSVAAVQAMIDECTPEELAKNLKDSGNEAYQLGRARWEDAIGYYTLALEKRCSDRALNAVIHSNRAQVHLSLENFGHAWSDCQEAVAFDERNIKAYFRGAKAAHALGKHGEAAAFCRRGLGFDAQNKELHALHATIHAARKSEAARSQQRAFQNWSEQQQRDKTLQAIAAAGIRCGAAAFDSVVVQQGYTSNARWVPFPAGSNSGGCVGGSAPGGELVFAVLFLYPQFFQSDFVQEVAASHTLGDHLSCMFPPEQPYAPWDRQQQYTLDRLDAFYEVESASGTPDTRHLYQVPLDIPLLDILTEQEYVLPGELPVFHIVPRDTAYHKEFVGRYKQAALLKRE